MVAERAAFEVDGEHGVSGDGAKAVEQFDDAGVFEVVQEKGAENEVEAARREREEESVAGDARLGRGGKVAWREIEAGDRGAGEGAQHDACHIARSGADVENREGFVAAGRAGGEVGAGFDGRRGSG